VEFWCLMVTALACAAAVGYFCLAWSATTLAFKITATYRKEYFRNIISKPIPWHDRDGHSAGALTAMVAVDPAQLQQMLGMNMGFTLISVLSVTGCLVISFYFGWKLTLVALGSSLPVILSAGFLRLRHERKLDHQNRLIFAESAKFASEAVGSCRTVTALTMEYSILERYEELLEQHLRDEWHKSKPATLVYALSDSVQLLCMAFVLWYGAKLLVSGEYYPFQYLVVYIAVLQGGAGAGQWLSFGPNIAQATAAANRILAARADAKVPLRKMPPPKELRPLDEDDGDGDGDEKGGRGAAIEFSNVWFRYPTRDAPVLNGLNLRVEKGQFAAIVGASGAGKTSIISLLERFYTAKAGTITYDGADINSTPLHEHRSRIALVAQQANLFSGTIRDNILAGIDASAVSEADVHRACDEAGIHDFVVSLPEGYDTAVGLRGVAMSGGQRQRIAIARALIRKPRLLLLDEATSALDSETERSVQRVFEGERGKRTMVWVAHRLATVQNADVIYVLSEGRVVESGTHAGLLARKGTYYHMCLAQALDR
jgi:ATP-binding cassette, subfamily B (MDR/TAP), member 1